MNRHRNALAMAAAPRRAAALTASAASLPVPERLFFEHRFGADFSHVRVHADGAAAELAHVMGAKAFTDGEHIVFGRDRYRPDAPQGRELLAHELAHVAQRQQGGGGGGGAQVEARAEGAARTVAQGGSVSGEALGGAEPGIHCDPQDEGPERPGPPLPPLKLSTPGPIDWLKLRQPFDVRGLRLDLRDVDSIEKEWDRSAKLLDTLGIDDRFKLWFITKDWILNKGLSMQLEDINARENPNAIDLFSREWKQANPGGFSTPIVPIFDIDWFRSKKKSDARHR